MATGTRFTAVVASQTDAINALADQVNAAGGTGASTTNVTTTARTMTAAEALSGIFITTAAGALALTLPTAAALVAAFTNAQVGAQFTLYVVNASNATVTLTTNTGLTINGGHGTATLPTVTSQILVGKFTNVTAGAEAVTFTPVLKTAS